MNRCGGTSVQPRMNTQYRSHLPKALAICLLIFSACAAEYDGVSTQASKDFDESPAVETGAARMDDAYGDIEEDVVNTAAVSGAARKTTGGRGVFSDRDLGGVAGGALTVPEDRLLEYSIHLTYRTEDYRAARRELLRIVSKYGHIQNSYASTDPTWSMSTTMRIRIAELYTVLEKLDELGELEAERIDSTDHTEKMVLAERKYRRERLRMVRRSAAARQTPAANKNWAQREKLISESEDRQDEAAHQQWQVEDRVSFAQVQVQLLGPDLPVQVEVPAYENAFVILLNWFLELLYAIILGAPLWLLLLALWLKRASIGRLLGIKKKLESTES